MKKSRLAAFGVAALLALTACAPTQSTITEAENDESTGTLRVWLFSEVNQDPKAAVVDEAVAEFEAEHDGVEVDVQYIPVDTRAERFNAAFNDPASAPDVAEFGNTDIASYVAAGGLADVTKEVEAWDESGDLTPSVAATTEIDGKTYGVPWFIGVRALYYRTDVLSELGLEVPTTLAEIETTARAIRAAKPEMVGIAAGGAYQYAAMPFLWAGGGALATQDDDGAYTSALTTPESRAGVTAYTNLLADDICPSALCAEWTGSASVQQFVAGTAGMVVGGDFNRKAVDESAVGATYAIVPLPGTKAGEIAPAFAGGNNLGVFKSTERKSLAVDFMTLLGGKKYQEKMFDAMGNLPTFTDVQEKVAAATPAIEPFTETLAAGTEFVPSTPAWTQIDAQGDIKTMLQTVATQQATVEQATETAAAAMDKAFAEAP